MNNQNLWGSNLKTKHTAKVTLIEFQPKTQSYRDIHTLVLYKETQNNHGLKCTKERSMSITI